MFRPDPRLAGSEVGGMIDFRLGRYQDVLQDVECDALICDPPYSDRTHSGHNSGADLANVGTYGHVRSNGKIDAYRPRREINYGCWTQDNVREFLEFWQGRNRGWYVCMSDNQLCGVWRDEFERIGLTSFQPVPILIPGMTVRLCGDGPSSWTVYLNVARPKSYNKWGTLPGGYYVKQEKTIAVGGKPLSAMVAIIRDYSKPGDLICDPCAGGATTLIAAASQGRRAVGSEMDADTYAKAKARIDAGYTPDMWSAA